VRLPRRTTPAPPRRRPRTVVDIALASGDELNDRLLEQGLFPDEVMFKYLWPRYAPPAGSRIRSRVKTEQLGLQFERLIAMHREAPAAVPLPVAAVRNTDGDFVGYVLEYVEGETLQALIELGARDRACAQLDAVERVVARLHAKSLPHGDLTPANILAADDGRTVLIDPVANPGPGTALQDEICLRELRQLLD
jgi:Ser/Thr protein kinase RdoA (MazF antagonist)